MMSDQVAVLNDGAAIPENQEAPAPVVQTRPDGVLIIAIAVARSGKSVWIKKAIENDKRVFAFDPKGEYASQLGFTACRTRGEVIAALRASPGAARISYVKHDKKEFDFFCDAAFTWNMQAQCTIISEELGNTTNCGKAAGHWGRLSCQGLAYGPKIIGTVQRGQEVDKTIMNNATFMHIGRHSTLKDQKYIADQLGVASGLIPNKPLEFIQWTSDRGIVCEGTIDFLKPSKNWPEGTPRFRSKAEGRAVLTFGENGKFNQIQYR